MERAARCSHIKGFILGTSGAGRGLDHPEFLPVLAAIEATGLPVFLHPHYGIGNEQYHDTGHALFLALGFPFETTVCVSRLIGMNSLTYIYMNYYQLLFIEHHHNDCVLDWI